MCNKDVRGSADERSVTLKAISYSVKLFNWKVMKFVIPDMC